MRTAEINRKTKETDISIKLNIDGTGESAIYTGIGFLDHMLESFAKHGKFDIEITCKGDTHVDQHHSVEDIGIVLGQAFQRCLSDKTGLRRFGSAFTPMDEALSEVEVQIEERIQERQAVQSVLDLSGRPYLVFNATFQLPIVGDFPTELVEEFFRAFAMNALITLHINVPYGKNTHHIIEAIFKGTARALSEAVKKEGEILLSTKGTL
jgi:imidazoleglycerol-phosphate dehydratase